MIGASAGMGLPGTATLILEMVPSCPTEVPPPADPLDTLTLAAAALAVSAGWLYNHVAPSTIELPSTKAGVIGYANKPTLARNEMTMLSEVANPLRMLSEYLMTRAVMSPPTTWVRTVPHAQALKFLNGSERTPHNPPVAPGPPDRRRTGNKAGTRENIDS
jgi:hypothetical protein